MADKEIKQIPFVASEVQMHRLERVINKLIIIDAVQLLVIIGLIIYFINR